MPSINRPFGRRDVKMFLLLWIPVAWVWVFQMKDAGARGEVYTRFLALSMTRILVAGFILFGAASGVERYRRLRRAKPRRRVWGEILTVGGSFSMVLLLATAGICGFLLWNLGWRIPAGEILDSVNRIVYVPFTCLHHTPSLPEWADVSPWLTWSMVGWITAYLFGKRSGRFFRSAGVAVILTVALAGLFYLAASLPDDSDRFSSVHASLLPRWSQPIRFLSLADLFSTRTEDFKEFFWRDVPLLLGFSLVTGSILLEAFREPKPRTIRSVWVASVVFFLILFFEYRALILQHLYPWPPRARSIVGLDPETGLLWTYCERLPPGVALYGIPLESALRETAPPEVQELYRVSDIVHTDGVPKYDAVSGSMLVMRATEDGKIRHVWRTPRGKEKVPGGAGEEGIIWVPVACPERGWYAALPADDGTFESLTVKSPDGKLFGVRIFLCSPSRGETRTILARPKIEGPASQWSTWPMSSFRPPREEPERVAVEATGEASLDDLLDLCLDEFFFPGREEMRSRRVTAILRNHVFFSALYGKPEAGRNIVLEAFSELQEIFAHERSERGKYPSSSADRGAFWEPRQGTLAVLENGKGLPPVITDATGYPSHREVWSPDGRYLVYNSKPEDATQTVLKVGYPAQSVVARSRRVWWQTVWSEHSDWLAVVPRSFRGGSSMLSVRAPPDFKEEILKVFRVDDVLALHDGSLTYIAAGKVYLWRKGWKDPVCVYDPERKTIRKEIEG